MFYFNINKHLYIIMMNFLKNIIRLTIYALIFCILLSIAIPTMSTREYVGFSLILGFFAAEINHIAVILTDFINNKYIDNSWYGD